MSVCNQFPVNGSIGKFHCRVCGDEMTVQMPIAISQFTEILKSFTKVHTAKGCNKPKRQKKDQLSLFP